MELTVAIPVYKNVNTLKIAIDSIVKQNNREIDYTIIISEDYSTDDIHEKVLSLLKLYSNIKIEYHFNKPALGMSGNWNNCIKLSKTKYVALLHDDDFLYPNYFDEVIKIMKSGLDFDVLFFDADLFVNGNKESNQCKGLKKIYRDIKKDKIKRFRSGDYFFGGLEKKTLPTCGTLYKREGFEEYDAKYGYSVDEIYAEILCKRKNVYYYNKVIAAYTYRSNTNLSSTQSVQRNFVLEKQRHRLSMAEESLIYKFFNKFLGEGMKLDSMYPWQDILFPEYKVSRKIMFEKRIFDVVKHIYIYAQICKYHKLEHYRKGLSWE